MATLLSEKQHRAVKHLYSRMPGAPKVSDLDSQLAWAEVQGNEHWNFCQAIVLMISAAVLFKDLDPPFDTISPT